MIGIDTNILVRFLTADDPQQYQQAVTLLSSLDAIYINPVVWVETVWVLTHFYKISTQRQCEKLRELLEVENIVVDSASALSEAIQNYSEGYDFADAVIGVHNQLHCKTTWTFDRKASRLKVFTLLK